MITKVFLCDTVCMRLTHIGGKYAPIKNDKSGNVIDHDAFSDGNFCSG